MITIERAGINAVKGKPEVNVKSRIQHSDIRPGSADDLIPLLMINFYRLQAVNCILRWLFVRPVGEILCQIGNDSGDRTH